MSPASEESGGDPPPHSPAGSAGALSSGSAEVSALLDAIRAIAGRDLSGVSDLARLGEIRELWPAMCSLSGVLADRVGDVHGSGAARADGFVSTVSWLRGRLHVDNPRAATLVRVGSGLAGLTASHAALAAGEISLEHAAALADAATDLGVVFSVELEKIVLDYAREHTPAEVRRLVRRIKLHLMDDDTAAERQIRLFEGRWLTASTTFEGMVHLEAMLDPVTGARVLAALEAYMPGPDPDSLTGRTARQRKADALADMVAMAMANANRADAGGEKPQIIVTTSLETLQRQLADAAAQERARRQASRAKLLEQTNPGQGPAAEQADTERADMEQADTEPADVDQPAAAERQAEQADTHVAGDNGSGEDGADDDGPGVDSLRREQPADPGPHAVVDKLAGIHDWLRPGTPALFGPCHEPICADAARRLACDARIIPVVLGSCSEPLDIGRQSRIIPTGLRRAVNLRDTHCRFPGCDRPPSWCEGHHVIPWALGGTTCLNNIILLCQFHHTMVHEGRWRLVFNPTKGIVRVYRPDGTLHDLVSERGGPAP